LELSLLLYLVVHVRKTLYVNVHLQIQLVQTPMLPQSQLKMLQKSKQKLNVLLLKTPGPTTEHLLFSATLANLNNNYLNPKLL